MDLLDETCKEIIVTRIPVQRTPASPADSEDLTEQIRQFAFHLFESRGGDNGHDLEDWLEAERQLVTTPESKLVQRDGKFEISIPVDGYEAREIHVSAQPASLVVRAASSSKAGHKTLLGTIDLPAPIDTDLTTAKIDGGVLYVTAIRKKPHHEPAIV
jgi:HSP20 family molecular chaperone IbpA